MSGANGHSGLAYGNVNDMRRGGFPSSQQQHPSHPSLIHAETTSITQHAPYQQHQQQQQQQQTYPTHQQTARTQYPQHFLSASPSQQVNNVVSSQAASRPPAQPQPTPTLAGGRQQQRVASSRQMPSQSVTYFNQALNQPMNPAPLSSQQLSQQSMAQSVMNHQQPMNQQALSQQALSQQALREQQMNQAGQQSLSQQSVNQQSLNHHQQQQHQQHPYQQSLSVNQIPNHQPPQHATQQPLTSQPLGPQSLTQHPLNQQSMTLQPPNQQSLSHSGQQNDSPMLPRQSTTPRPQAHSTYTTSALPPTASPASQPQQPQHAHQVQQQVQLPNPLPAQQHQQPEPSDLGETEQQIQQQLQQAVDDVDMASGEDTTEGDSRLAEQSPFVRREPMGPMMSAPPQGGSFPTLEAVHQHVLTYCTSVGYAIVIGRSKKTVPGLKKVLFVCDRAGKPPKRISPEQRKRKTSSRKCDCQFGFFAIEQRTQWTVRYRPDPKHLVHNHPPSESPLNHPAARKLDTKMIAAVKELQDKGKTFPGCS
ncbi:hypothetical protein DL546_009909 [Coniochaeta pulveracea]|uniref:FAR1 domain-containing protein n=1 Tax=Coniochaeta pulveracea TaxID=177199 RepID=A0A420YEU3_9PEZI|nr:hypothetical protein DL546_009909 [Coniochaeta pulveracea]